MKKLTFAFLLLSLATIGTTQSMDREAEIHYVQMRDLESVQDIPTNNETNENDIDDINSIYGQDVTIVISDDDIKAPTCTEKIADFVNTHKHAIHTTLTGALALTSVWLLGQDNPMTSMIFLNGFSYNLGRMLPKTSNRQILRYTLPALLTAGLYGVDVALGKANIDTNWAFGLIGASVAQVSWTKRLHKAKNNQ